MWTLQGLVGSNGGVKKIRLETFFFFPLWLKRNRDPRGAYLGEEKPLWNGLSTIICACQTFYISKSYPSMHNLKPARSACNENGKSMIHDDENIMFGSTLICSSFKSDGCAKCHRKQF